MKERMLAYGLSEAMIDKMRENNIGVNNVSRWGYYNNTNGIVIKNYPGEICHANLRYDRDKFKDLTMGYYSSTNYPPEKAEGPRCSTGMNELDADNQKNWIAFVFGEDSPWKSTLEHLLYRDLDLIEAYGFVIPEPQELTYSEVFNLSVAARQMYEYGDLLKSFTFLQRHFGATPHEAALICFSFRPPHLYDGKGAIKWETTPWKGRMQGGHDFIDSFEWSIVRFVNSDPSWTGGKFHDPNGGNSFSAYSWWEEPGRRKVLPECKADNIPDILSYIRRLTGKKEEVKREINRNEHIVANIMLDDAPELVLNPPKKPRARPAVAGDFKKVKKVA